MCDACSQVPCIQMCCPHGEAFVNTDPDDPYQKSCKKNEGENRYNATFHDKKGEAVTDLKRNEHYLLVAPKEGKFRCPVQQMPAGSEHFEGSFAPLSSFGDPTSFKIVIDGSLKGTTMMYNPQEFCVVQTDVVSENNSTNLEFQLFICKSPSSKSQDPGSGIPIIFLLLLVAVLLAAVICFFIIRRRRMKKTEDTASTSVEDDKEGYYGKEEYTYHDSIRSASYT